MISVWFVRWRRRRCHNETETGSRWDRDLSTRGQGIGPPLPFLLLEGRESRKCERKSRLGEIVSEWSSPLLNSLFMGDMVDSLPFQESCKFRVTQSDPISASIFIFRFALLLLLLLLFLLFHGFSTAWSRICRRCDDRGDKELIFVHLCVCAHTFLAGIRISWEKRHNRNAT